MVVTWRRLGSDNEGVCMYAGVISGADGGYRPSPGRLFPFLIFIFGKESDRGPSK